MKTPLHQQADVGQGVDEKRSLSKGGTVATDGAKKTFHTRGFVSLLTGLSLLVMTVTGVVLYFVPQGRIASWIDWRILWLTKTDWGNIHTTSSILFAVCAGYHLYLNWRVFVTYVVNKINKALSLRKEQAVATTVILLVVFGTIYYLPPLNYVVQFSDYLKGSWASKDQEPPFGHAEQLSLRALARRTNIDLQMAIAELRDRALRIEGEGETLEDVARKNRLSPMEVYAIMALHIRKEPPAPDRASPEKGRSDGRLTEARQSPDRQGALQKKVYTPEMIEDELAGKGIGKKTIEELCREFGVSSEDANRRLKRKGMELREGETLKEAAALYRTTPIEIARIALADG